MNIHQSNWSDYDYVSSYAIRGNEDYQRLQSLLDSFRSIPVRNVVVAATDHKVSSGAWLSRRLREGKLEISKKDHERARWELDYATKMEQVAKTIGGRKEPFYEAVMYAYRNLNSEGRNRMEEAIRQHAYDFPSLTKPVEYLKRFDAYYNEKVTKNKKIKLAVQWEVDCM